MVFAILAVAVLAALLAAGRGGDVIYALALGLVAFVATLAVAALVVRVLAS